MAGSQDVTIASLFHDFRQRNSFVTLVWTGDPQRQLVVPVPFGVGFEDVHREAEKALRALAAETATLPLKPLDLSEV